MLRCEWEIKTPGLDDLRIKPEGQRSEPAGGPTFYLLNKTPR